MWRPICMLLLVGCVVTETRANAEDVRIIVRGKLDNLIQLVSQDQIQIIDPDLSNRIREGDLDALVVSDRNGKCIIQFCDRKKTKLEEATALQLDCKTLRDYAVNGHYLLNAVRRVNNANSREAYDQAVTALITVVKEIPQAKRKGAELFVGASFAGVESSPPNVASFVFTYKKYLKDKLVVKLTESPRSGKEPFVFGEAHFKPLTLLEISKKIDPKGITMIKIDGKDLKIGWCGNKMLVVPAPRKPPQGFKDPLGLGIPVLWKARSGALPHDFWKTGQYLDVETPKNHKRRSS